MAKPLDLKIGDWSLDARSMVEETSLKAFRYSKNFRISTKRKLCRASGFEKAFTGANFNNQDLHDQLLAKSGNEERQPINFLFEATSTRKNKKLIAGTNDVLFALNNGTGNWKILADVYGNADSYWRAAELEDVVVFSNAFDCLGYWNFDQGITEENNQSIAPIPDLVETLEISKAGVVVAWKGHVFLMNVTVAGASRSNGIYWCNYKNALDWIPSEASTAGNADIDYGETILAALPLASRLLIYTDKGIWECSAVGGEQVFQFVQRYSPDKTGESCLFYPRTLVSKGDEHVFAGEDGIYAYSLFMDKPKRPEWIHKASSVMFDSINASNCKVPVAGYNSSLKELYFSYATGENTLPNETLVMNTEYPFASVMDHGFSAMVQFTFRGTEMLFRDFLRDNCICTDEEIGDEFGDFVKEGASACGVVRTDEDGNVRYDEDGNPRLLEPEEEVPTCEVTPTVLYTSVTRTETYGAESIEIEDWEEETAETDSLSDILAGETLQSMCEDESSADECNTGKRFILASSEDYCLKQTSDSYFREICTVFTGCGYYEQQGYKSLLRGIIGGNSDADKLIRKFEIEASHVDQVTPSQFALRIGNHSQAIDPNSDACGIVYETEDPKDIDCLGGDTANGHIAGNTRPSETYKWPLYIMGNYIYWELTIENPNVDPVDTGGSCCLSRISLEIEASKRNY